MYSCPNTPRIILSALSLNMLCFSAGAVLCGTCLGLEYEKSRRRRILRIVYGLAYLPASLIILLVMSRHHDAGPNPYLEGSTCVYLIIFLSVCRHKIFFLPVDFQSNLPSKPRCAIWTSQPRIVEYGLINSRAMDHIPLFSLHLQQAVTMSMALLGDIF